MDRRGFLNGLFGAVVLAGTIGKAKNADAQRWTPPDRGGWRQQVIQGMNRRERLRSMSPEQRRLFKMRRRRRMMMMRQRGF